MSEHTALTLIHSSVPRFFHPYNANLKERSYLLNLLSAFKSRKNSVKDDFKGNCSSSSFILLKKDFTSWPLLCTPYTFFVQKSDLYQILKNITELL